MVNTVSRGTVLNKVVAQAEGFWGVFRASEGHECWNPGLHKWEVVSSQEG